MILKGETNSRRIKDFIKKKIGKTTSGRVDYVECVNAKTLKPSVILKGHILIALATWFGPARLIDNVTVRVPS